VDTGKTDSFFSRGEGETAIDIERNHVGSLRTLQSAGNASLAQLGTCTYIAVMTLVPGGGFQDFVGRQRNRQALAQSQNHVRVRH